MAGTSEGAKKAAAKNLASDPDFYRKIGAKGGRNGKTGGFAADRELARRAGAKGGRISRRGKTGFRRCSACLEYRQDVVNGFCASCRSQDTPETRAVLGIDAQGRDTAEWQQRKSTSTSVMRHTSSETVPSKQPNEDGSGSSRTSRSLGSKVRGALRHLG